MGATRLAVCRLSRVAPGRCREHCIDGGTPARRSAQRTLPSCLIERRYKFAKFQPLRLRSTRIRQRFGMEAGMRRTAAAALSLLTLSGCAEMSQGSLLGGG